MPENGLNDLYNTLKSDFPNIKKFADFQIDMRDTVKRREAYDYLSGTGKYDMADFETFQQRTFAPQEPQRVSGIPSIPSPIAARIQAARGIPTGVEVPPLPEVITRPLAERFRLPEKAPEEELRTLTKFAPPSVRKVTGEIDPRIEYGITKRLTDFAIDMTSPLNATILVGMGFAGSVPVAQRILQGVFSIEMMRALPNEVQTVAEGIKEKDPQKIAEGLTGVGLTGGLGVGLGRAAIKPIPKPTVPVSKIKPSERAKAVEELVKKPTEIPVKPIEKPPTARVRVEARKPTPEREIARIAEVEKSKKLAEILKRKHTAEEIAETEPVKLLSKFLKEAKPLRAEQERARTKERGRRGQMFLAAEEAGLKKGLTEEQIADISVKKLGGELPGADIPSGFEPLGKRFTENQRSFLYGVNRTSDYGALNGTGFEVYGKAGTKTVLDKLLRKGELPTPREAELLTDLFGAEVGKAIWKKRPLSHRVWENVLDAANIPRATLTMWDLSASLRQGGMLGARHPIIWTKAFKEQLKSAFSEKYTRAMEDAMMNDPRLKLQRESGLYIAQRAGRQGKLSAREEVFMSKMALKIPGVRWSERGYVTMLNRLRTDVFNYTVEKWKDSGYSATKQDYGDLAKFINAASGRGRIGKKLGLEEGGKRPLTDRSARLLNAMFFSPRYAISRFQAPLSVFSKSKRVRMEAASTLIASVTVPVMLLSMGRAAGLFDEVELDPRSSDFGKARIGNTRIDPFVGYLQPARYIAQAIVNERKQTDIKKIIPLNRLRTIGMFVRSKLSPGMGFVTDVLDETDVIGQKVTISSEIERWKKAVTLGQKRQILKSMASASETQFIRRFAPIFAQDVGDMLKFQMSDAYLSGLAFFGMGLQTYEPRPPVRRGLRPTRIRTRPTRGK